MVTLLVVLSVLCLSVQAKEVLHHIEFFQSIEKPLDDKEGIREWVVMTNSSGLKYNCSLPVTISEGEDEEAEPEPLHPRILAPLESACLFRSEGWWTYEFCHKKHLRQFHAENKKVIAEFFLGVHEEGVTEITPSEVPTFSKNKGQRPIGTFSTTLEGGSICDLTGSPRKTDILFQCGTGKHTEILSLRESATCEYTVVIATPLLCEGGGESDSIQCPINCYIIEPETSNNNNDNGEGERCVTEVPVLKWQHAVRRDVSGIPATATPDVLYATGQCFRHKKYKYRGVLIAADPVCLQSDAWIRQMGVNKLNYGRNQPFYHAFVDTRDRPGGQVSYVAQENIVIDRPDQPLKHPMIKDIFSEFIDGQYVARGDVAITLVPEDDSVQQEMVEKVLKDLVKGVQKNSKADSKKESDGTKSRDLPTLEDADEE